MAERQHPSLPADPHSASTGDETTPLHAIDSSPHTTAITLRHDPANGLNIVASPGAVAILKWLWTKIWPLLAAALVGKHYLP